MDIVHVSRTDLVGGRFNGYYMNAALAELGHSASMIVWQKESESDWVHSCFPDSHSLSRHTLKLSNRIDRSIDLDGLTGLGGLLLSKQPKFQTADLLHLHLIHDSPWFSPLSLPSLAKQKPLVWTIHDCWAFTGSCVYPMDCDKWMSGCSGKCPYPRSHSFLRHLNPSLHWKIKKSIYKKLDATLVVASNWLQQRVKTSPLLKHMDCHLIPFGIDLNLFSPKSKANCKRRLGIDPEQKVIVFRAMKETVDKYKGIHWLREALKIYQPQADTCILTVQDGQDFTELYPKYRVLNLNWTDGVQLADALNAADVFLMPSTEESFGMMAIEAMACGTPVIVFDGTALPETIHADEGGGIVVPRKNSEELARAINQVLENDSLRIEMGHNARNIAEKYYSFDTYISRHLKLYESIIESHRKFSDYK